MRRRSANHWCGLTLRPRKTTTRMAVVRVLSWYLLGLGLGVRVRVRVRVGVRARVRVRVRARARARGRG